jgi:hypothetical protein
MLDIMDRVKMTIRLIGRRYADNHWRIILDRPRERSRKAGFGIDVSGSKKTGTNRLHQRCLPVKLNELRRSSAERA